MRETLPFGRLLKQLRTQQDLTQDALAERVGCAAQTVRTFESGTRRPSRDMAERLAEVLAVPPDARNAFVRAARAKDGEAVPPSPPPTKGAEKPLTPAVHADGRTKALPVAPNALIGREGEHGAIRAGLLDPQQRLVTLLGPGGIGKTRLALQVATDLQTAFPDGIAWVSLASVAQLDDVPTAIADALQFPFQGTEPPETQLLHYLRERELLLVLDNLEHLLDTARFVADLLQHALHIKVLTTSRERLRVAGEWVVELGGLALPHETGLEHLTHAAAVLLFVERARQIERTFALTPDNGAAITRICRLLEGMPLGIELAAAWLRTLNPTEIADEIGRNLDFLTLAERTATARHRSLRAVFEHSWRLLNADEQQVLAQLSVFQGGCDRQAAVAVAGASLATLASLVDKSLLRRTAGQRYDLHPLVQQYAQAKLQVDDQAGHATQERHCAYYAALVEAQFIPIQGGEQIAVRDHLSQEIDNIRAAWAWAIRERGYDDLLRMIDTLLQFFELRDWLGIGERMFAEAAEALLQSPAKQLHDGVDALEHRRVRGRLLANAGYLNGRFGRLEQAQGYSTQGIALLEGINDEWGLVTAHETQAIIAFLQGNYEVVRHACLKSLAGAEALGHNFFAGSNLILLALLAEAVGNFEEARTWHQSAISLARKLDNAYLLNGALAWYGELLATIGEYAEAHTVLLESLTLAKTLYAQMVSLHHLAITTLAQGQPLEALPILEQGLQVSRQHQNHYETGRMLNVLGDIKQALMEPEQARIAYQEALTIGVERDLQPLAMVALVGLAQLAQHVKPERARQLATYTLQHPASSREAQERATQLLVALGCDVGELEDVSNETLSPLEEVAKEVLDVYGGVSQRRG